MKKLIYVVLFVLSCSQPTKSIYYEIQYEDQRTGALMSDSSDTLITKEQYEKIYPNRQVQSISKK